MPVLEDFSPSKLPDVDAEAKATPAFWQACERPRARRFCHTKVAKLRTMSAGVLTANGVGGLCCAATKLVSFVCNKYTQAQRQGYDIVASDIMLHCRGRPH